MVLVSQMMEHDYKHIHVDAEKAGCKMLHTY
jgi:hypothetical protein